MTMVTVLQMERTSPKDDGDDDETQIVVVHVNRIQPSADDKKHDRCPPTNEIMQPGPLCVFPSPHSSFEECFPIHALHERVEST